MISNLVRIMVMALLGLMMVPYYIDEFGMAVYGILPLATSLTTYVIIASDGLASSFSRYMIMAIQSGDEDKAITTYSSSIIGMAKVILKVMPVVLLISIFAPYIFQIGPAAILDVQVLFLFVLLSALVISFTSCLHSVFYAQNNLYTLYYIRSVHAVLQAGLVIIFFFVIGPNLMLVGLSYFISSLVYLIWTWVTVKFMSPTLHISRECYDRNLLREMTGLGFWAMISTIGALMFIQTSLVLVNLYMGAEMESEFSIVVNIISMLNTTCMALTAAGEPLIYRYYNEGNKEMLLVTLSLFTKFVGLIIVFPIAYICIFTPQVLDVWIGHEYDHIVPMARIMVPANIAVCSMHILNCLYLVQGKLRQVAITTCILGLFNVVLTCILLAVMQDPTGASIAWAIAILSLNAVFMPLFASKIMGFSQLTFFKPIAICYIVFFLLMIAGEFVNNNWTMPSSFFWVVSTVLAGFILYMIIVFFLLLNRHEKGIVLTYLPQSVQNIVLKLMR